MINDYTKKGLTLTLEDTEVKNFLDDLKKINNEFSTNLSFARGFEKGCLDKEEETKRNIEILSKIDTVEILDALGDIAPLLEYLKGNKDDVYIKQKIICSLNELNNYFVEVLNKENESESV